MWNSSFEFIWGSTFLSESVGIPADTAAALITFYFIGIQIAFSYLSVMLTPVLFSAVTTFAGISVFPHFLLVMFLLMVACTIILKIGDAKSRTKRQNV